MFDFLLCVNIFIFGFLVIYLILRSQNILFLFLIYFWHTIFSVIYYYLLEDGADALKYYNIALNNDVDLFPGTPFVVIIAKILLYFDGNMFSMFMLFNIFGSLGLIILFVTLNKITLSGIDKILLLLIIFLPSISFWSSALGKDSLSFLAICLFIYGFVNNKKYHIILLSLFLMFMVRPHVGLILLFSYFFYVLIFSKINYLIKLVAIFFTLPPLFFLIKFVTDYTGLSEQDSLGDYVNQRQNLNMSGGSSIDIQSMSLIEKLFSYMFRPLPYEANSIFSLYISIENLFLLIIIIYFLYKSRFNLRILFNKDLMVFSIYFISCLIMLSFTTANLGIAIRQKWMFLPVVIYIIFYLKNFSQKSKF